MTYIGLFGALGVTFELAFLITTFATSTRVAVTFELAFLLLLLPVAVHGSKRYSALPAPRYSAAARTGDCRGTSRKCNAIMGGIAF